MMEEALFVPCVIWDKQIGADGYGVRHMGGTGYGKKDWYKVKAHRQAWVEEHGPIPEGKHLHHLCENKACVNTAHLRLMTNNEHRGALGHGKLLKADADKIRERRSAGERSVDLAAEFGVSKWTIFDILGGRIWT